MDLTLLSLSIKVFEFEFEFSLCHVVLTGRQGQVLAAPTFCVFSHCASAATVSKNICMCR